MKKFLIFFLLISYNSFSQCKCEEEETVPYDGGSSYTGCLNDRGERDGFGIYRFSDGTYYEGCWKDNVQHGEGIRFMGDQGKVWGTFEDGEFVKGNSYYESDGRIEKYEGGFKGNQFNYHGQGKLINIEEGYQNVTEGEFKNNELYSGIQIEEYSDGRKNTIKFEKGKTTYREEKTIEGSTIKKGEFFAKDLVTGDVIEKHNDGLEIKRKLEDNIIVEEIRNDRNYYNIDDIDGDVEYTEIALKKKGNANEGISYLIPMKVSGTSTTIDGEWIFDTGAESFSIGKRMYERMKEEGMQFKDLNMEVQSIGVGGISNGELIVINEITIGDYKVKNVIAKVNLDNNFSLLGMWFLIKFKEVDWSMKNNTLKLYR